MRLYANISGAMSCNLEMQRHREAYIEDREDVEFGVGARGFNLQWERACGRPTDTAVSGFTSAFLSWKWSWRNPR